MQCRNNFPRMLGILGYILCSELNRHFCKIFNVTLSDVCDLMQRRYLFLVAEGEIHATFLVSNLLGNL